MKPFSDISLYKIRETWLAQGDSHIRHIRFAGHGKMYGSPIWNFGPPFLHKCLLGRAVELHRKVRMKFRVGGAEFGEVRGVCTVLLREGRRLSADLVVGAVGVRSGMWECLVS